MGSSPGIKRGYRIGDGHIFGGDCSFERIYRAVCVHEVVNGYGGEYVSESGRGWGM